MKLKTSSRDEYTLWFHDFVKYEEDIIFFSGYLNELFRANIKNGVAVKLGEVFSENADCLWQYGKIYCFEDRLFLLPGTGKNIVMYNIKNGDFQYVYHITKPDGLYSYFASVALGREIYFWGYETPEILSLNVDSYKVKSYDLPKNYISNLEPSVSHPFFNRDICILENSIYVTSARKNEIIELNLSDNMVYIHLVGSEDEVYQTIAVHGQYLYLVSSNKAIVKVSRFNWQSFRTAVDLSSYAKCFSYSQFINDELWLFPGSYGVPIQINVSDFDKLSIKKVSLLNNGNDIWFPPVDYRDYPMVKLDGDELYFISGNDMCLHMFKNGQEINSIKIHIHDTKHKYLCREMENKFFYRGRGKYIHEDIFHFPSLNDFITYINRDSDLYTHPTDTVQNGKIIYNKLIQ